LNEISDEMVNRYVQLFNVKCHDNTLLLLQDAGAWMYRDEEGLKGLLNENGWFLNGVLSNWDIEETVGQCGHGDAVTTWWFTRHEGEHIPRFNRRCDEGACTLYAGDYNFSLPGSEHVWTRYELERGTLARDGW
jgi:hypothetical protein